jgi:integrase
MTHRGNDRGNGSTVVRHRRKVPSAPDLRLAVEEAEGGADRHRALAPLRRPAGPAMSVAAACELHVESVRVRRPETRTAENYEKVLLQLCDFLDARGKGGDVWAISADDIEDWLRYLQTTPASNKPGNQPRSPYTIRNYATHVIGCWHALAGRGLVPAHVADALVLPAIPRSRRVKPVTFGDDEVAAIFAACAEGERGAERDALTLRNQALVAVLLDSGVRVGEVCSMRVEDVDWQRRAIPVLKSKTETRIVSIGGEQTAARLRRYVQRARPWLTGEDDDDDEEGEGEGEETNATAADAAALPTAQAGALWLSRDGYPLSVSGVSQIFDRLKRRATIHGRCTPHVCRRYYITRAIQRGVPIVEVARQCGVSPEVIYRHYYSATDDESLAKLRQASPLDALERARQRDRLRHSGRHGRLHSRYSDDEI